VAWEARDPSTTSRGRFMTVAARSANRYFDRPRILDKGFVIDIYLRVSLVGIEMLTADARIVIAECRHLPAFRRGR
jgi:hypothetical protein